ncbi:HBR494Cp [Eremothecium sinecaudum]|uniref:Serine/threonine-protein kinase CBK1 n=1 Tax=Eremothecium sinecaudum TaxID=45286 RepID=A0A120K1H7_9SACH|nr:HBR494Cp [Eremothecium sinecaudum]AMD19395.1 HBR494Cp [Eremothecium sinecaudum]
MFGGQGYYNQRGNNQEYGKSPLQRPAGGGFSSNYMKQQGSHHSLQEYLATEQQAQQQQQQQLNAAQRAYGAGFTDIPTLDYRGASNAYGGNNYANSQHSSQAGGSGAPVQPHQPQQLLIHTPPPTAASIYSQSNSSFTNVNEPSLALDRSSPLRGSNCSDYGNHSQMKQQQTQSQQTPQQLAVPVSPFHSPLKAQPLQDQYLPSPLSSGQSAQPVMAIPGRPLPARHSVPGAPALSHSPTPGSPVRSSSPGNYMYFERRPELLSKSAQEKAAAVKLKIENFYQTSVNHAIERNQRRVELESQLLSQGWSEERKSRQLASLGKKESQFLRLRRTRLSLEDFNTVKVIGKGAFGEVRLVQKKDTGKIYAMKTLLKSEMYKKDQLAHVKAERDVLAGSDSPWVVSLYYSFQDAQYLYLIMEFLPGGDLMTMLIRWQIFTEDVTRFYMAECILAIEAIHKLGFIHRDIKPDNILIDIRGHIKLSDFGLSTGFHKTHDSNYYKKLLQEDEQSQNGTPLTKPMVSGASAANRNTMLVDAIHLTMTNRQQMQTWRKSRRLMAYSTVGTPDYIAPEIFLYQGYGQECDWWSLGAIMYECLIGWPPFCSETPQETYRKIMNFEQTLQFPDDVHISYEAEDLIRRLLSHSEERLGRHGGAQELKNHPFFRGVDWDTIRQVEAPYIPKLSSITDARFFPTDELENIPDSPAMAQAAKQREQMMKQGGAAIGAQAREDMPFIGYTYSRFDYLTRKNAL